MRVPTSVLLCLAGVVALVDCSSSPTGNGSIPTTAAVTIGNVFFQSNRNNTTNAAVDTVAVGGRVTWTWVSTGTTPHSVESEGSPSFTSSAILTGDGMQYAVTFNTAGTYQYDCLVHGSAMTGRVVVR